MLGTRILTDSQKPCPCTSEITRCKNVRHKYMELEDSLPDIKCVMPVIRQEERVVDPRPSLKMKTIILVKKDRHT